MHVVPVNKAEILRRLARRFEEDGSLSQTAAVLGVSPAYLCLVMKGRRELGPKLLKVLKLRKHRIVVYEEKRVA